MCGRFAVHELYYNDDRESVPDSFLNSMYVNNSWTVRSAIFASHYEPGSIVICVLIAWFSSGPLKILILFNSRQLFGFLNNGEPRSRPTITSGDHLPASRRPKKRAKWYRSSFCFTFPCDWSDELQKWLRITNAPDLQWFLFLFVYRAHG